MALFGVFIGYIALRYYLKDLVIWARSDLLWHNYKTSKLSPQKKIIKDTNFEFIHEDIEKKPTMDNGKNLSEQT